MIYINLSKFIDLFKIVGTAFLLAFAGNHFFSWDFYIGLFIGLILGVWESIYELIDGHVLVPADSVNINKGDLTDDDAE